MNPEPANLAIVSPDFSEDLYEERVKGTLLGYKVYRRESEVVMVSHAQEISNRRCVEITVKS